MKILRNLPFFLFTLFITSAYGDFGWNLPPANLSDPTGDPRSPLICCDASGNAFAIWDFRADGSPNRIIQVSRFDGTTLTWSDPFDLNDDSQSSSEPEICCDNSGNAIAVWENSNGSNFIIRASHFDGNTQMWSDSIPISAPGQSANAPRVCCDNFGNAFAIWDRSDGSNRIIQVSHFDGTSWTPLDQISNLSANGQNARSQQICCDDSGNAIAVWYRSNGSNNIIQSSYYNGTSWTPINQVFNLSADGQDALRPRICCDDLGNAIAVWQRSNGSNDIIQSSRFNGSSWEPFESGTDLSESGQNASAPRVCCDNSGNAIAVWERSNGSNDIIQASFFDGSSWTAFSDIDNLSTEGQNASFPYVCCDNSGNAFATWYRSNGSNDIIQSSQFDGVAWSIPDDLSAEGVNSRSSKVCCNDTGRAINVWNAGFSPNPVIQSSFYLPQTFPPANFQGNRVTNRFPSQSAVSAHLSWTPNTDPNVTSFNIYQNGNLVATVPSYLSSYKDCNIDPCQSYSYTIISVNTTGDESAGETIVI